MEKQHLPIMGVGPAYVIAIIAVTVTGILLSQFGIIAYMYVPAWKIPCLLLGFLIIIAGVLLWGFAVFGAKIDNGIVSNRLVTDGVYAYVRNPIYSAFLFSSTGAVVVYGNFLLFILPLIYWLLLTVLMKHTEEKWLKNLYGMEYEKYCSRVNRCIPWFPKKL